eukprot:COSAG05_NODE_396_length_10336_cov_233.199863_2_plen_57_part_00
MLGRRGKADPGRHPVRAAPEAAENRFMGSYGGHAETFTQADGRQTRVVDVNLSGQR